MVSPYEGVFGEPSYITAVLFKVGPLIDSFPYGGVFGVGEEPCLRTLGTGKTGKQVK